MAAMNTNIPMMGQGVNALQAIQQGTAAAEMTNQNRRNNALEQFMQTNGGAVMSGDEQALGQYAALAGPEAALGVQNTRLGMDATRQGMARTNQVMRYADTAEGRAIEQHAASLSAADREALTAKITQSMVSAATFYSQGNLAGVNQVFAENQLPAVESLDQAAAVLAQADEARKVIAGYKEITGAGGAVPSSFDALHRQAIAAGFQEGTPQYQEFMANGGGSPATFRALDMQARAAGLVPATPQYQEFMATRGAGLQAGARVTAENIADVETGGDAARVIAAGTAAGKASASAASELAEMERNMPGLLAVVAELNDLADIATYTLAGQARDELAKQTGADPSEGAIARARYIATVDNQVLPLLRQTFGAAFTAKEGDTLRQTLGDPNKSPEEKKAVLDAFIAQKRRDLIARGGSMPEPVNDDGDTEGDIPTFNVERQRWE